MDATRVDELLEKLDGSGSEAESSAAAELRQLGLEFPRLLLRKFHSATVWRERASCVTYAMKYARKSDDAIALGREAVGDESRAVRYHGSMLLAYSLRKDVLPDLDSALRTRSGGPGEDDIRAAIDAIENQNHNYFLDREHTGKMFLNIE
jgi:hypothetical protein